MMILSLKLLVSSATLVFALGFAARRRSPFDHRRLMALGLALALSVPAAAAVGKLAFNAELRTGYWLVDLLGSAAAARWVTAGHQAFLLATLLLLAIQAVLGGLRRRGHLLLARIVIPCWLLSWVGAMFFYF